MGVTYLKRRANSPAVHSIKQDGISIAFAKNIYEKLSNITENKSLTIPTESTTQYEEWLLDMDLLAQAMELGDTSSIPENIINFNKYLGTLGLTDTYPFADSTYAIEPWLSTDSQSNYRYLYDTSDLSVLMDGDEMLIANTN